MPGVGFGEGPRVALGYFFADEYVAVFAGVRNYTVAAIGIVVEEEWKIYPVQLINTRNTKAD